MGPHLSKPTIGKSPPHPPRVGELELEEGNEGEELPVARTLLSDGTRVDRIGVLSTRTSFFREKVIVHLVPLVGCVRPIAVITLGLHFEPRVHFTVHNFSCIYRPICTPRLFPRAPIHRHVGHRASGS